MQQKLLSIFFMAIGLELQAQLTITNGAQFYMTGAAEVSLHNTSLVNNGSFGAGQGTVHFTGNGLVAIDGTQSINFYRITINKTSGSTVKLERTVNASDRVLFTEGFLDLTNFNLNLGLSGWLSGESNTARILTLGNGKVTLSREVDPYNNNPGNIGLVFTTTGSLGTVNISRGHQVQVDLNGMLPTVRRYYDFVLPNGPSFSGALQVQYLDAELNGADENTMTLYTNLNESNWLQQTIDNKSNKSNFLEISGTIHAQRWAIANGVAANTGVSAYDPNALPKKADPVQRPDNLNMNKTLAPASPAFRLWPNPSTGNFFICIHSATSTTVAINIMDSKGTLIRAQQESLHPGINQVTVIAAQLPAGAYIVHAVWNNGLEKKTTPFIKQ